MLLVLAGLAEGIGLAVLLPLLQKFGVGQGATPSMLQEAIEKTLAFFSIPNTFGALLLVVVAIMYLQVALQLGRGWFEADCQTRYTSYWQRRLFDTFINAQWMFFASEKATNRVALIMTQSGRIAAAFFLLTQIITAGVLMAIYASLSLLASWQVVVLLAGFAVAIYFALRPLSWRGHAIGESITVVNEALQHRATEFIQSAKLVKATGTEQLAMTLFGAATENYRAAFRKAGFHSRLVQGVYMIAGYTMLGAGMWATVSYLEVNPSVLLVSIYVFLKLYMQLTNLQQNWQSMLLSLPAFPAAMENIERATAMEERLSGGQRLPDGPAAIRLKDVTARYGDFVALDRLTLDMPAGSCIGITGASGAGKSTLVDIVVGLLKTSGGTVTIDGVLIDDVALRDWRRSIGYVGQDTLLLNGTVAENIAWGTKFDLAAIEEAARAANAHEFIAALPQGYDTQIGDRGMRLSGGQRQRLSLARALIGAKRLLILDEATSALDSESENAIMRALAHSRGKITMMVVAHRLSTLRESDEILVLDKGRVAERGTWSSLIESNGPFARLLELQDVNKVTA
ncbi:MAG: ABC transporter ATP-binding protein [Pseudolabrys sp.]